MKPAKNKTITENAEKGRLEKIAYNAFSKAYKKFPHRIKKPNVLIMGRKNFIEYLEDSPLDVDPDITPAFIAHTIERDTIIFCFEILKKIFEETSINIDKFIEAVAMHELYHEWNRHRIENSAQALASEVQVDIEMKNDFPELHRLLEVAAGKLKKAYK